MRVAWLTDIHLDEADPAKIETLWQAVEQAAPDAMLLGGDISIATRIEGTLLDIAERIDMPIYFVLGNHDYYHGSIGELRWDVELLTYQEPSLKYLTIETVIELTPKIGLIGHDGWSDTRLGTLDNMVALQDDVLIREFSSLSQEQLIEHLRDLGEEAADHIQSVLPRAMDHYPHVYLLMHMPPFKEACWYEGKADDRGYVARFTCGAVGQVIQDIMPMYADRKLTILAGHTHAPCKVQIIPNVEVIVAAATNGEPAIAHIFELDEM